MGKMFDLLKEGLEEAISYEKGSFKNVRVKKVRIDAGEIPQQPKEYQAKDIKHLRNKLNCSQSLLAAYLNVSLNTIQAWEQGSRRPSHAALRLLEIMDRGPQFLASLIKAQSSKKHLNG
ncbi:helix-turn-helix domain-containing protein [Candidatus Protochlamydia sp. R18]|uniref:helix-turn-helix domain-containing protein n=1 Tax=Candidatus Protochlamydia sp. R18 TaxID=1353977 RepID=UPI0006935928|nr:helix-turn-helix domain-containing protein [Candidatus Protochlamydia sp. R18]